VITGKTFQFLSMRKPVIVADTAANRELLAPGRACFVPPGDAAALAAAVYALHSNPVELAALARRGHQRYRAKASEGVIAEELRQIVEEMLA
jgi:glycosyltransferase involved in cell wall biosynthesis